MVGGMTWTEKGAERGTFNLECLTIIDGLSDRRWAVFVDFCFWTELQELAAAAYMVMVPVS